MDNAKNNTPKKVIISTAIGIVSMLIIIVGATYAYWNAKGTVNFNTATITYETEDKSIIVLNGTTGLLTLGTIEGTDMPKVANNIVYYAGEEDKSRTPQEVTIGVATYDEEDDRNIYRCTFTLALTHGGSADLIDRFLSDGYTNRSEGQIIITVNGVEYDLNDGFPNSITGYTDVDIYHPGAINVGMKFVNIGTLNQDYLIETNGHININVTSFSCQAKKELALEPPTVKYWTFLKDDDYRSLAVNYNDIYTNAINAKKFDDYHDLQNMTLYTITSSEMDSNLNYVQYYFTGNFTTLAACEDFIDNYLDIPNLYVDFRTAEYWECEYDNENEYYYLDVPGRDEPSPSAYNSTGLIVEPYFESESDCEDFLEIALSSSFLSTTSLGSIFETNYTSNTLTCSAITIDSPFFVRETKSAIISPSDKWELFKTENSYLHEDMCISNALTGGFRSGYITPINPNDNSYCINRGGYYLHQKEVRGGSYQDFNYPTKYEPVLYDSETECLQAAQSELSACYDEDHYNNNQEAAVDCISQCVKTRTTGEVYYNIKLEMCLYKNDKLFCYSENEDSFYENMETFSSRLETAGYQNDYVYNHYNSYDLKRIMIYDDRFYPRDGEILAVTSEMNISSSYSTRYYKCDTGQEYGGFSIYRCSPNISL